jgi:hypothetical protein
MCEYIPCILEWINLLAYNRFACYFVVDIRLLRPILLYCMLQHGSAIYIKYVCKIEAECDGHSMYTQQKHVQKSPSITFARPTAARCCILTLLCQADGTKAFDVNCMLLRLIHRSQLVLLADIVRRHLLCMQCTVVHSRMLLQLHSCSACYCVYVQFLVYT